MTSRRSSKEGSDFIDSATGISVAVRIRPLNQRELRSDERNAITFNDQSIRTKSSPSLSFGFDHVLDPNATNRDVYEAVGMDIVKSTMIGINSTIFAYGQTSTGKTHTMFGSPEDPGITRLAVADIFKSINNDNSRQYLMRGSYMEIYNEMIKDLLKPENNNLKVHQHPTGEVFVGELSERMLTSFQDVMNLLEVGDRNRHVGETNMNELSSRSHTIFRMTIESQDKAGLVRVSLLNLVDLAGSERVGHTGAEGQRLVEGGHINKSLLSLGTVIAKLSEGDSSHIPFRDSKLTRILQSSLGQLF